MLEEGPRNHTINNNMSMVNPDDSLNSNMPMVEPPRPTNSLQDSDKPNMIIHRKNKESIEKPNENE